MKRIIVISKESGKKCAILPQSFDGNHFEKIGEKTKQAPKAEIAPDETEEQEFERMKAERAWLKPDLKERYRELKEKLG